MMVWFMQEKGDLISLCNVAHWYHSNKVTGIIRPHILKEKSLMPIYIYG